MDGSDVRAAIVKGMKNFAGEHGVAKPRLMRLPLSMAYSLASCGSNELPYLSEKFLSGNPKEVLEREGIYGMRVEVIDEGLMSFE
ncbi:MAG: hypothetical protein ACLQGP_36065 [Isosphaeraceae bacterium]